VAKASTEPLFSVQARVLAGPAELAWIDEPDVEVINAMARGCAPQRPGTHPEASLRGEGAAGRADGVAVQNGGAGR
jgi:hypothetical protein